MDHVGAQPHAPRLHHWSLLVLFEHLPAGAVMSRGPSSCWKPVLGVSLACCPWSCGRVVPARCTAHVQKSKDQYIHYSKSIKSLLLRMFACMLVLRAKGGPSRHRALACQRHLEGACGGTHSSPTEPPKSNKIGWNVTDRPCPPTVSRLVSGRICFWVYFRWGVYYSFSCI